MVSQLNTALVANHLQFSNPSPPSTTLRITSDGSGAISLNAASATTTVSSLASGSPQLPLFTDGNSLYTGQITGMPIDRDAVPGSMGRPLPGIAAWVDDGELVVDPSTVPTFFRGYVGDPPA